MSMTRWPFVALGDVLTRSADWVELEPDENYKQVTIRLWGKGVNLRGVAKGSAIAASQQLRVKAGQFILSKIDARNGAFGLVPNTLDGAVVSQDFPTFDVDEKRLLPEFLAWMTRTTSFVALCRAASEGSTNRVRLKEDRFLSQDVGLPSLQEQHQIVSRLDTAASLVEKRKNSSSIIESELKAMLATAFANLISGAPIAKMRDVAPIVRRRIEIEAGKQYTEIGIRSFYKGIFHRRTISGEEFTWQKLFSVREGDLVFSNLMAWEQAIGSASQMDDGCVGNHRMLTCEPDKNRVTPNFLLYFFQTKEGFSKITAGSPGSIARNKTLSPDSLGSIEVPIPPLAQQQWFDRVQASVAGVHAHNAEADRELGHLIPAMLHSAFRKGF